jgi:hypothetical protein
MHRKDSHWFLPTESPANTTLPFLPLFRISLALNLSRNRRSKLRKISIQRLQIVCMHELIEPNI